jgi:hypothetical protein
MASHCALEGSYVPKWIVGASNRPHAREEQGLSDFPVDILIAVGTRFDWSQGGYLGTAVPIDRTIILRLRTPCTACRRQPTIDDGAL